MTIEFQEFPKIARLNRGVIWSEKIDGSNACIVIAPLNIGDGPDPLHTYVQPAECCEGCKSGTADCDINPLKAPGLTAEVVMGVWAQSRSKFIIPGKHTDNYGFAGWVQRQDVKDLAMLGPGYHYGEWWGQGVNRGYGLTEKRFSLFNVSRWNDPALYPKCCYVVPVLGSTIGFDGGDKFLADLRDNGSRAAPGYAKPEGVVGYHTAAGRYFKATCERDAEWKGRSQ